MPNHSGRARRIASHFAPQGADANSILIWFPMALLLHRFRLVAHFLIGTDIPPVDLAIEDDLLGPLIGEISRFFQRVSEGGDSQYASSRDGDLISIGDGSGVEDLHRIVDLAEHFSTDLLALPWGRWIAVGGQDQA